MFFYGGITHHMQKITYTLSVSKISYFFTSLFAHKYFILKHYSLKIESEQQIH